MGSYPKPWCRTGFARSMFQRYLGDRSIPVACRNRVSRRLQRYKGSKRSPARCCRVPLLGTEEGNAGRRDRTARGAEPCRRLKRPSRPNPLSRPALHGLLTAAPAARGGPRRGRREGGGSRWPRLPRPARQRRPCAAAGRRAGLPAASLPACRRLRTVSAPAAPGETPQLRGRRGEGGVWGEAG